METYGTIHNRVTRERGRAALLPCADCGGQAAHWSYDHGDPNELQSRQGPYSVNTDYYSPRCWKCHQALDGGRPPTDPATTKAREHKAREARIRRASWRHGLKLERNRARRADAPGYGTYALTKVVGTGSTRRVMVVAGDPTTFGLDLDQVEDYLKEMNR